MSFQSMHPTLPIHALKHSGVFSNGCRPIGLTLDEKAFLIRYDEDDDSITIAWDAEEPKWQTIKLEWTKVGYGYRPYFICPLTDSRRLTLYFHIAFASAGALGLKRDSRNGGRVARSRALANKAEARLAGLDGAPSARGKARVAAARKLKATELGFNAAQAALLDSERIERARLRRRQRHHGAYSTATGLAAGAHAALTSDAIVAHLASRTYEPLATPRLPLEESIGLTSDYPTLDIRMLEKTWRLDEHGCWGTKLVWLVGPGASLNIFLMVSFDPTDRPALFLEIGTDGKVLKQTIELEPSHPRTPKRWFMKCPVTGIRAELLYFRGDRFACAKAQRLVHPSQRSGLPLL